jgi:hypothetical protein
MAHTRARREDALFVDLGSLINNVFEILVYSSNTDLAKLIS